MRKEQRAKAALRELFRCLRSSPHPVLPLTLTHAMGWKSGQLWERQNVFEFFTRFTDYVFLKIEGAPLYDVYASLFAGKLESSVNGLASRVEEFWRKYSDIPGTHLGVHFLTESRSRGAL
jgi:hypothetical protein